MFPGVVFAEPPQQFAVTSAGQDINLEEDAGISVKIPENSLAQSEAVEMTIATSFAGLFQLPDGVQAVSSVHFIKLSDKVEFKKAIKVWIQHNAVSAKGNSALRLMLLKTTSTPPQDNSGYAFNVIKRVRVETCDDRPNWGVVKVRSFSGLALGVATESKHGQLCTAIMWLILDCYT